MSPHAPKNYWPRTLMPCDNPLTIQRDQIDSRYIFQSSLGETEREREKIKREEYNRISRYSRRERERMFTHVFNKILINLRSRQSYCTRVESRRCGDLTIIVGIFSNAVQIPRIKIHDCESPFRIDCRRDGV